MWNTLLLDSSETEVTCLLETGLEFCVDFEVLEGDLAEKISFFFGLLHDFDIFLELLEIFLLFFEIEAFSRLVVSLVDFFTVLIETLLQISDFLVLSELIISIVFAIKSLLERIFVQFFWVILRFSLEINLLRIFGVEFSLFIYWLIILLLDDLKLVILDFHVIFLCLLSGWFFWSFISRF